MLNIGPQELIVILAIALLVVGPSRLPELGRTLGRALRELRRAQEEVQSTLRTALNEPPPAPTPRAEPAPAEVRDDAGDGARPANSSTAAAVSEAVRAAEQAEPAEPDEPAANEVARTLGRSLAELRRAREEIRRGLRGEFDPPGPGTP
jgi:sec-independent protein translocase protein TatA